MAGSEGRGAQPRRRFVTRHDVDDAAAAGRPLSLGTRDVLTHEAAQRARDLGVPVTRGSAPAPTPAAPAAAPAPATVDGDDRLRQAVRAAVGAELGR